MKAAVIGCNGYIGKHMAWFLMQQQWEVHGYGKSEECSLNLTSFNQLDLTNKEHFERLNVEVDYILYFSALTGTVAAFDQFESYIDINEKGLLHLLNRLRQTKSKAKVIFPSTRLVYKGAKDKPLNEDAEKEFKTIYALNKWFGEQVLQQYSVYFGIPYSIFRICVPYGNLFNENYSYGTIGFFLKQARLGQQITLFGDGELKRTFTYVEDICRQIYKSIEISVSENNIFNIGGETFSLRDVAKMVAEKYNVEINYIDWPIMDMKLETGDTIFDSSRIDKLIGIHLKKDFQSWLAEIT